MPGFGGGMLEQLGLPDPRVLMLLGLGQNKDLLLNILQGADPTMGLLGSQLPQPEQQNLPMQLIAGAMMPGMSGGEANAFRSLDDVAGFLKKQSTDDLIKWLDKHQMNLLTNETAGFVDEAVIEAAKSGKRPASMSNDLPGRIVDKMGDSEILRRASRGDPRARQELDRFLDEGVRAGDSNAIQSLVKQMTSDIQLFKELLGIARGGG